MAAEAVTPTESTFGAVVRAFLANALKDGTSGSFVVNPGPIPLATIPTTVLDLYEIAFIAGLRAMQTLPTYMPSYPKASLPAATPAGQLIYVTNDVGGAVPAFSDGTNWRRVTDRNIIS